jgi:glycosyltransferase involved in cell wall biosynthesis
MKVAIIHEWLDGYAGSERVLEEMMALHPQADIFALVDFLPAGARGFLQGRTVHTSFLQRVPLARHGFRWMLGLMPLAIEQFDLSSYRLILSSSHSVAKGVLVGPDQVHVSYVHSPMRYAWDLQHQYLQPMRGGLRRAAARWLLHRLRIWDLRTANGVDLFIANSGAIARRVQRVYRRQALVVHPPVDLDRFRPALSGVRRESYLVVSRLVSYKQIDLVVRAFAAMPQRHLVVIGDGPERARLQACAGEARNITWCGQVSAEELGRQYRSARALVHAAEEDFGIALVEAQASGTPVIAYARGGAVDIVATGARATGVLFEPQTPEALIAAVERFEHLRIDPQTCRDNALRFSKERFRREFARAVDLALAGDQTPSLTSSSTAPASASASSVDRRLERTGG